MGCGAGIPLLIVPGGGGVHVGLAPIEDYSPSDALMLPRLLPARSLLSPVHLPAASFMGIVATRQIPRSQRTQKGQSLPWASRALGGGSLLIFICPPGFLAAQHFAEALEEHQNPRPIWPSVGPGLVRYWAGLAGRRPARDAGRAARGRWAASSK